MKTQREQFKRHLELPKDRLTSFLMLVLAFIGQRTVTLVFSLVIPTPPRKLNRITVVSRVFSPLVLFRQVLPCTDIRALSMDREFVGIRWLSWLSLMDPFVAIMRSNILLGFL